MSALPPKADTNAVGRRVRFGRNRTHALQQKSREKRPCSARANAILHDGAGRTAALLPRDQQRVIWERGDRRTVVHGDARRPRLVGKRIQKSADRHAAEKYDEKRLTHDAVVSWCNR